MANWRPRGALTANQIVARLDDTDEDDDDDNVSDLDIDGLDEQSQNVAPAELVTEIILNGAGELLEVIAPRYGTYCFKNSFHSKDQLIFDL